MAALNFTYRLKEEIIMPPVRYPVENVKKVQMENGKECWSMNYGYYLHRDIKNTEDIFYKDRGACLKQYDKGKRPYPQD